MDLPQLTGCKCIQTQNCRRDAKDAPKNSTNKSLTTDISIPYQIKSQQGQKASLRKHNVQHPIWGINKK